MQRVCDALAHLYVLIPVLDADKHYWVGEDEIDKLLRRGKGWLESHPAKEEIANRYLRRKRRLTQIALAQLTDNTLEEAETADERRDAEEESTEKPIRLNDVRHAAVFDVIKASGASRIVDLGCGEGKLLYRFLDDKQFTEILGVDVSMRALEVASDRLHLDTMPEIRRKRIRLLQSSLTYLDDRLQGFDAGCAVEVIEHLDPDRLTAFERTVFGFVQPNTLVVTTPNVEYNAMFPAMPAGRLRHRDHRFEWTREQFRAWASGVAERYAYRLRFEPVGPDDPEVGPPTQMAVFER